MQIHKSAAAFVVLALVATVALEAREQPEPCSGEFKGALLLSRMEQIAMTASALHLLNGTEDRKLKRLLTFQLATAAADARRHIEEGAKLGPARLTSIADGLKRATSYLAEHGVDRAFLTGLAKNESSVFPPSGRRLDHPAENLAVVSEWLAKHQASMTIR